MYHGDVTSDSGVSSNQFLGSFVFLCRNPLLFIIKPFSGLSCPSEDFLQLIVEVM